MKYFDSYKNEDYLKGKLDKYQVYFLRGACRFYTDDISGAGKDFESIDDSAIETIDDSNVQKSHILAAKCNNAGVCCLGKGMLNDNVENLFRNAIGYDRNLESAYCNLAALFNKQGKQEKAQKALDDCPIKNSSIVEDARMKMNFENSTLSDWYKWWFSHGKAKRFLGIIVMAAILAPLVGVGLVIGDVYLINPDPVMRDHFSTFIKTNASILMGGLAVILTIVVGILLLPSLQRLKVGTALELETLAPKVVDSTKTSSPLILEYKVNLGDPHMLIEYKSKDPFVMPLQYQRQRFFMPIDSVKMPKRYGSIIHYQNQ